MIPYLNPLVLVAAIIYNSIKILMEYERGVIFFLGKFQTVKGPGLIIVIPVVQKMLRVNLQTVTIEVPAQDVITRDNVSVKVNAVIFFRVVDPQHAILAVQDYLYSSSQIAQTTLRSVLGQSQLDELLSKREEINVELQRIIDQQTEPWGVKVSAVEVKNVDLPPEMLRAIAKQAEAERERRAKVIHAEGEFQAAQKLFEAADVISRNPTALQLRFLQTLVEVASEELDDDLPRPHRHHCPFPPGHEKALNIPFMEQALTYRGVARKALDWVRESRYTSTQIVIGAFLAMILVGTLLLMLPFATTGPGVRFVDALFTMTSAVCVTGLIVLDTPKDFTLFGQLVILLGMQIGGRSEERRVGKEC